MVYDIYFIPKAFPLKIGTQGKSCRNEVSLFQCADDCCGPCWSEMLRHVAFKVMSSR